MGLFKFLFGSSVNTSAIDDTIHINPASGLPMSSPGVGGVDVEGNPFGTDSSLPDGFCSIDTSISFDDPFDSIDSGYSSFDDW